MSGARSGGLCMRRLLAAVTVVVACCAAPAAGGFRGHVPGCRTRGCDERIGRVWARHHRPKVTLEPTVASWYGPADSGGALACGGGLLTSSTLGVANKTLPCGTRVRVCLRGCVTVRVVDRGPYIAGRSFDLTEATARAVGFLSVGVGTVYVAVG